MGDGLLERGQAVFELADLEQSGCGTRGRQDDSQPSDPVLEANAVGYDDIEEPPDPGDGVEPGQVVGNRDRAFFAPAQPTHPPGLGRLGGSIWVMGKAIRAFMEGRHLAGLAVWLGATAAAFD
jgi:hypothetical protein